MFGEEHTKRRIVSLTPLIDVVFLLLIFFMLASTFLQSQSLTVLTPAASAADTPADKSVVEVYLTKAGTFRLDGEEVDAARLASGLKERVKSNPETIVSILVERGAEVQPLITAVEAARNANARAVSTSRVEGGKS